MLGNSIYNVCSVNSLLEFRFNNEIIAKMTALIRILFLFSVSFTALSSDIVYKSVDEDGKVTYSSTPPKETEPSTQVNIAPPPSQERINAAQQRHERNMEAGETFEESRKKHDEFTAKENRLKREKQKRLQQQKQEKDEESNEDHHHYYQQPLPRGRNIQRPLPKRPSPPPPTTLPAR